MWRQFVDEDTVESFDSRFAKVLNANTEHMKELDNLYGVRLYRAKEEYTGKYMEIELMSNRFVPFPKTFQEDDTFDPQVRNFTLILLSNDEIQATLQEVKDYYLKKYRNRARDTYKEFDVRRYVGVCRLSALVSGNVNFTSQDALDMFNATLTEEIKWTQGL